MFLDVQQALSRVQGNKTLLILPLDSGRFALFDRALTLQKIVDELDPQELRNLSQESNLMLSSISSAARFYGEPSPTELARDLRRNREQKPKKSSSELDFDIQL
jgi:hypothetical protein